MARRIPSKEASDVKLIHNLMSNSANNRMMCAFVVIGLRAYTQAVKDAPVELTPDLVHPPDWLQAAEEVIAAVDKRYGLIDGRAPKKL